LSCDVYSIGHHNIDIILLYWIIFQFTKNHEQAIDSLRRLTSSIRRDCVVEDLEDLSGMKKILIMTNDNDYSDTDKSSDDYS
jgi:hypothetical protein